MYRYVLKRILITIPILLGVLFVVFFIIDIVPGDPGRTILGISAAQEDVDALNHKLGYDQPFFTRFFNYLAGVVTRFDFGTSYTTSKPVAEEIAANFGYTFRFTLLSTAVSVIIGIGLGVMSAIRQYSVMDSIARITSMCLAAFPSFWIGMIAIYFFSLKLGWFPSNGLDTWKHYVLPVSINGILGSASLLRMTRAIMLESIRQDYVRTARAKGAPEKSVIWRHAFRNVMLPLINSIGINFATMMGGTVYLENIFSMPGLGSLALTGIRTKNVPLVLSTTFFLSAIFCMMVLVIDLVSAFVDPRVRAKYSS